MMQFDHVGMNVIGPMPLLLFLMMCMHTWWQGSNLGSEVFADEGEDSTNVLVEPFSFTVTNIGPNITGKRVGVIHTDQFSWHWPGDDESILTILVSIVDMTILSTVNSAIAGFPDTSWNIQEQWGCWEKSDADCGQYAQNGTPMFNNNSAARWVMVAIIMKHPTLFQLLIVANEAMGHLVPSCLCLVAVATNFWMTSSYFRSWHDRGYCWGIGCWYWDTEQ